MNRLLIVDDNDKYARILTEYFGEKGYEIEWAKDAAEGLAFYNRNPADYYKVIVTDITMESQLAGIHMLKKINRLGYKGTVVIASTGFDVPTVIPISRLMLRLGSYGVHFLVRKTTVLAKDIEFWPMTFFTAPSKEFQEIV